MRLRTFWNKWLLPEAVGGTNGNGDTYKSWNWKGANGTGVKFKWFNNDPTVSANTMNIDLVL